MVKHVGSREQNDSTRLYSDFHRRFRVLSDREMGTQRVTDEVLNINTSRLPDIDVVTSWWGRTILKVGFHVITQLFLLDDCIVDRLFA